MFVDRYFENVQKTSSILLAGCDPVIEALPEFLAVEAGSKSTTDGEFVSYILDSFCDYFVAGVQGKVPAVKPNIAFFEQYGLQGTLSFHRMCLRARDAGLLVVVDAKRGDIGSTAQAYAKAFLGGTTVQGREYTAFYADALTVNPFLGYDTIEPFILACERNGKGLFVLVQTSNPGAKDIEGLNCDGRTVSERIADWLAERAERLGGISGWSGLGAVVGATYPAEAVALRKRMPKNLFLIPGYGAQGGTPQDAVASFVRSSAGRREGGIVNASRALLSGKASCADDFIQQIADNAAKLSNDLHQVVAYDSTT